MTKQLIRTLILILFYGSMGQSMWNDKSIKRMRLKLHTILQQESPFSSNKDDDFDMLERLKEECDIISKNASDQLKGLIIKHINLINFLPKKLPFLIVIHRANISKKPNPISWNYNSRVRLQKKLTDKELIQLNEFGDELSEIIVTTENALGKIEYLFHKLIEDSFIELKIELYFQKLELEYSTSCMSSFNFGLDFSDICCIQKMGLIFEKSSQHHE